MSVDLTNATTTIPSSRFGLISIDGDQSVSLNTFSGTGTLTITQGINTTPNGIGMSAVGIAYDNGTTTTSTSWDTLSNKIASLSAVAPNALNASLLVVNETISIQNEDTAPTRVINTSAGSNTGGEHFGVAWVGNSLPFVMETLDATDLVVQDTILNIKQGGGGTNQIILNSSSATITITDGTNTNILTPVASAPVLSSVLSAGNNAGGQSITNVNDIACVSINSTSYPPPAPSLSSVLSAGNNAGGQTIDGVYNINTTFINGSSITSVGLLWSDFNAQNAYNNLPSSNAYALDNSIGSQAETRATGFYCYNNGSLMGQSCSTLITPYTWSQQVASNEWLRYDYNGGSAYFKLGYDNGSNGTTFSQIDNGVFISYQKSFSTGYEWRGRFIMEADNGLIIQSKDETNNIYKPIKLNASDCFLNDGVSSVSLKPKITGVINGSANWSIGAGGWNNIVSATFGMSSAWTGSKNFAVSLSFNNYDAQENTASLYYYVVENGTTFYPYTSSSSYAVPCFAHSGYANNSTTATTTDILIINNTSGGSTISLYINIAHNGGTWSGNGFWSFTLTEV